MTWSQLSNLKYAGTCSACHETIPKGSSAWFRPSAPARKRLRCLACGDPDSTTPLMVDVPLPTLSDALSQATIDPGSPGAAADAEYQRLSQALDAGLRRTWGPFAPIAKFLAGEPQSVTAWAKGSAGEKTLAQALTKRLAGRAALLHDRAVPRSRANIDHLAVASSGVWVIDAKKWSGRVEQRQLGGWFKDDRHLFVAGRERSAALKALVGQLEIVRGVLGDSTVPLHAALCFVDADWSLFAAPFTISGTLVTWPVALADAVAAPGPLTPEGIVYLATRLAEALPPKVVSTPA